MGRHYLSKSERTEDWEYNWNKLKALGQAELLQI